MKWRQLQKRNPTGKSFKCPAAKSRFRFSAAQIIPANTKAGTGGDNFIIKKTKRGGGDKPLLRRSQRRGVLLGGKRLVFSAKVKDTPKTADLLGSRSRSGHGKNRPAAPGWAAGRPNGVQEGCKGRRRLGLLTPTAPPHYLCGMAPPGRSGRCRFCHSAGRFPGSPCLTLSTSCEGCSKRTPLPQRRPGKWQSGPGAFRRASDISADGPAGSAGPPIR